MLPSLGAAFRKKLHFYPMVSSFLSHHQASEPEIPPEVLEKRQPDMPVEIDDPFLREKPKCVLCKYNVEIDYKNVRLLSQFVSSFTGKLYERHVSGLCEKQQKRVERALLKAQGSGLMPYYHKDPIYSRDPPLFDPERPFRPHKY